MTLFAAALAIQMEIRTLGVYLLANNRVIGSDGK
jgi:hypothetical protein